MLNEATAGAALKYHIKRALERSHSISDFSKQLELSAKDSKFTNNTLKIIEELNNGVKQASEEIKEATKPSNLIKSIREQDTRPFEVIEDKEAFFKDLNKNLEANATLLPKGMSVEEFKKSLESVGNKDRFLGHLETRDNSDERLAALNLVEPILREPHIEIFTKDNATDKKEYIKALKDENNTRLYMLITQDNDTILRTFITDIPERYVRNHVRNADIIHSFIQPNRTAKSDNALSDVVVYGENAAKKPLTSQEDLLKTSENLNETTQEVKNLSPLELANAEKLAKLESERLAKAEKERLQKIKDKEKAQLDAQIRAQKNATLGKSELDREIAKSENIPYKELENASKTSVSLNDDEIHPLKFVVVNKSDLKPNFKNTGTQTRTAVDSKKVEEIAERFDPKLIIGRGGFDDLPIILQDGQVIAGNHRVQGMLNFSAESRKKYEQALKDNFNIELKPDELLVRMPEQELSDKEIFKLASKSNENRANSFSDTLLSAMSSYNDKLKHLPPKFESDSVENLANQVARVLERDAKIPSHTQVENANLSLLSHYATNTPNNSFLEVFDNAYKNLDREQFKAFKEMFANNSANFHNLNNDATLKNFTISPYLTDALDSTAKMLESGNRANNFDKLAHDINYLIKSTDENGMNAFIKENKDAYNSVISELLGSSFARFLRLENPSAQFYEFLTQAKDRMIENAADIFAGTSKPISQINIFDFIKYGIESGKSSKESRELLDLLPDLEKKFNAYKRLEQEPLNAVKLETQEEIKERAFKVIEDKEAFLKDLNAIKPMQLPSGIDTDSFLNAFNGVKNKENFIKHLKNKPDSKHRLAYLHLVEPTLKEPDITLIFKNQGKEVKKEHIKAFQGDPKTIYYFLVAQDNDSKLITGLKVKPIYIKAEIDKADIIHSFIPQARTLKE